MIYRAGEASPRSYSIKKQAHMSRIDDVVNEVGICGESEDKLPNEGNVYASRRQLSCNSALRNSLERLFM
jgi:hypothetical protein